MRILIVDDDTDLTELLRLVFESKGFGVTIAHNGEQTSEILEEELPEVIITIDRLVSSEAEIRCSGKKAFSYEDREVSLVYVAYGALQDCPSGCFSSFVCGIYDPDESLLYKSSWHGLLEKPLSIPPDCAELADVESGTTSWCSTPPPGIDHPVTQTVEFETFRNSQREDGGDWRFCFW